MKIITIIVLSFTIFQSCQKQIYKYLDTSNSYVFTQGDILVYKGSSNTTDSFYVSSIEKGFRIVDKTVNYEMLNIKIKELTKDCKNNAYDYCWGIIITRDANKLTDITFRNDYSSTVESSPLTTYKIGTTLVTDVYSVNFRIPDKTSSKDVKTVYYCHKYGIVGYELVTGEKIEIEEKYLQ